MPARTITLDEIEAMTGDEYAQFKRDLNSKRAVIDASEASNPDVYSDAPNRAGIERDITEAEAQVYLDKQEARHRESRVLKLLTPFEDAHRVDVMNYGADSPSVMSVRDRLLNAFAKSEDKAQRAALKEALDWKPAPKTSMFADGSEDEGAE